MISAKFGKGRKTAKNRLEIATAIEISARIDLKYISANRMKGLILSNIDTIHTILVQLGYLEAFVIRNDILRKRLPF